MEAAVREALDNVITRLEQHINSVVLSKVRRRALLEYVIVWRRYWLDGVDQQTLGIENGMTRAWANLAVCTIDRLLGDRGPAYMLPGWQAILDSVNPFVDERHAYPLLVHRVVPENYLFGEERYYRTRLLLNRKGNLRRDAPTALLATGHWRHENMDNLEMQFDGVYIPKNRQNDCLAIINKMAEESTWQPWVKGPPPGGYETLCQALTAWRYQVDNVCGEIWFDAFTGSRLGMDIELFRAIAYCISDGAEILIKGSIGEDTHYLLLGFHEGIVIEEPSDWYTWKARSEGNKEFDWHEEEDEDDE